MVMYIYSCGDNRHGQLGINTENDDGDVRVIKEIKYFKENDIKIADIASGSQNSLAVDINGRLYAWGFNIHGECGDGTQDRVMVPKLVEALKKYKVELIRCGYNISYCKTVCNKHFIWGQNDDNECLTYKQNEAGEYEDVLIPHRIDNIIKNKCGDNVSKITQIHPGYYSTHIIVE